jgi:hypothetical protein
MASFACFACATANPHSDFSQGEGRFPLSLVLPRCNLFAPRRSTRPTSFGDLLFAIHRGPLAVLLAALVTASASSMAASAENDTAPSSSAAESLYAHHQWAAAALAFESVTKREPLNAQAWSRLGICYSSLERWPDAIRAYRTAEAYGSPPQFTRYNLACAYARNGQADSAFVALNGLAASGYRLSGQLESDPDLASLRKDSRFASVMGRVKRNATPCAFAPESRQFDFWIGDWEVRDNQRGQGVAGSSHVESILGGCVIFENWTGSLGGSGKSFNAWNPELRCWQQNWMDDSGNVTNFTDGHLANGALTLMAEKIGPDGKKFKSRLTFFNLGPNQVRQLSEQSVDGGVTWTVAYDFNYLRKK